LALAAFGTYRGIATKSWQRGWVHGVFAVLNFVGLIVSFLHIIGRLPWVLGAEDLVPFLWDSIAIPVGLIVPIGGAVLALLIVYVVLDYVAVLMYLIMRALLKRPGSSAIEEVA